MLVTPTRTAPTEAIPMHTTLAADLAAQHRDALLAEAAAWRLAREARFTRVTWRVRPFLAGVRRISAARPVAA
ncbi:hypothetical protein ACQEVB_25685 [Pseudonocardia sp. CA-107938]|uniref:hypothetical protein n=1 Tax=Pseudonocardia sp. CA-107938 TaxID=3240021 RepID=UPI003D94DCCF